MSLSNECTVSAVAPVHLMESYRAFIGIAPFIRTLDSEWS